MTPPPPPGTLERWALDFNTTTDLAAKLAGREVWYAPLLQDLASLGVVEPTASVASDDAALFAPRGHYAPALNAIVGAALAEPVQRAAGRQARAAR